MLANTLELSVEERDVRSTLLENDLSELRYEIGNTDSYDFRQGLKHKEEVLKTVLARLRAS